MPSPEGRAGACGRAQLSAAGVRTRRQPLQRGAATSGSATDAGFAPCPSPFSGQAAATPQRRGGRCQGRVSAERSEDSLDRRSPPSR
jgi:hypothetical protein